MVQWSTLPLWSIERHGDIWAIKVDHTFADTVVSDVRRDHNLRVEIHATDSGRLIGYTIRGKREPLVYRGTSYLGLFYSKTSSLKDTKQLASVIYRDSNVRLLAFGGQRVRDYLFVMRVRGKVDATSKKS